MTKKINFMCTAFRDGFQSAFGARVLSKDYLPIVKEATKAGISYFESGGGALFQSPFLYTGENAFDVMDAFRKTVGPQVKLQTLARGINVVGLDSQPRDVINLHAKLFKKHGVDVIRNFDALNDPNNLLYSGQCIKDAGLSHQLTLTMMSLPPGCEGAHNADFYEASLKRFLDSGIPFDSLCFKDASGTSVPSVVYETVRRAKNLLGDDFPLQFHSHETAGVSVACYISAIEAGVQTVDLSLAPVSGGTCSPDIATFWHVLRGSAYELDVDVQAIMTLEDRFKEAMKDYFLPKEALKVEPQIPWSPMPGGALTANTQMLRDNGLMDKFPQVIKSMEEVVRKGGFGTSVTPVSQFYFQQAFNNVMFGPWKKIAEGYGKMVLGYFGKTPMPPDEKVVEIASNQMNLPKTDRLPLDINEEDTQKGINAAIEHLKNNKIPVTDENIFIVAACGEKGIAFLQGKKNVAIRWVEKPLKKQTILIGKKPFDVELSGNKAFVNGKEYAFDFLKKEAASLKEKEKSDKVESSLKNERENKVASPLNGTVSKVLVSKGEEVDLETPLFVIEVMKMEVLIKSKHKGIVQEIKAEVGEQVEENQILAIIR